MERTGERQRPVRGIWGTFKITRGASKRRHRPWVPPLRGSSLLMTQPQTPQRPASGSLLRLGLRPAAPSELNAQSPLIHDTNAPPLFLKAPSFPLRQFSRSPQLHLRKGQVLLP